MPLPPRDDPCVRSTTLCTSSPSLASRKLQILKLAQTLKENMGHIMQMYNAEEMMARAIEGDNVIARAMAVHEHVDEWMFAIDPTHKGCGNSLGNLLVLGSHDYPISSLLIPMIGGIAAGFDTITLKPDTLNLSLAVLNALGGLLDHHLGLGTDSTSTTSSSRIIWQLSPHLLDASCDEFRYSFVVCSEDSDIDPNPAAAAAHLVRYQGDACDLPPRFFFYAFTNRHSTALSHNQKQTSSLVPSQMIPQTPQSVFGVIIFALGMVIIYRCRKSRLVARLLRIWKPWLDVLGSIFDKRLMALLWKGAIRYF